jgi:hypothetical protein
MTDEIKVNVIDKGSAGRGSENVSHDGGFLNRVTRR